MIYGKIMKTYIIIGKIYEKYGKNVLITGHLRPFWAIGSIGNEFAASI